MGHSDRLVISDGNFPAESMGKDAIVIRCDGHYLLPILSGNRKSEEEYAEYQHALRKLNYDLKQLAVYCGIKLNVSSYTSRHTWATLAKYCHFSEQLICDALGHSSTKVTETYLKSFKNDELDRANKVIINHISISI